MKFKLKKISKKIIPSKSEKVYDLTVEKNHSYCVNNIIVHNCGYPQLSAVMECADAAHGLKGRICSDGGCRIPADIVKSYGAGADFVMLGGMLAGTDECEGKWLDDGSEHLFHGMSSEAAMKEHNGGMLDYRSAEGKEVKIQYKGSVKDVMLDLLGGLRSACTYVGAVQLRELTKRCTFIKVNNTHNKIYE